MSGTYLYLVNPSEEGKVQRRPPNKQVTKSAESSESLTHELKEVREKGMRGSGGVQPRCGQKLDVDQSLKENANPTRRGWDLDLRPKDIIGRERPQTTRD